MNLAKVSANRQITVPFEICRLLNVKEGDKLCFERKESGEVIVNNSSLFALQEAQEAVAGTDFSEEEVLAEVMKIRYGENA